MAGFDLFSGSDRGLVRTNNEDSVGCVQFEHSSVVLAQVADGVGGYEGGEVASRMAVDSIENHVRKLVRQATSGGGYTEHWMQQVLPNAISEANQLIRQRRQQDAQLSSMATTLVAALWHDHQLALASLGDSRCYRWRDNSLQQLTRDHTVAQQLIDEGGLDAEQVRAMPYHHVLSRALGLEAVAEAELHMLQAQAGDRYLLCSDGLTNCLDDARIAAIMARKSEVHECGEELIASANDAGGVDNISVVLVQLLD